MKILICGGRDFTDELLFWGVMDNLSEEFDFDNNQPITIISGCAKGADTMAINYAITCGWELEKYPADWNKHGKAAGPIRNQQMLDEGKPDLVVVFPGGKGTFDMKERASRQGYKVRIINETSSKS